MNYSDGLASTHYFTSFDRNRQCDSITMSGPSSSSTSSISFWSDPSSQSSDSSSVNSDSFALPSTPSPCHATRFELFRQEPRSALVHGPSNLVPTLAFSPPGSQCWRRRRRSSNRSSSSNNSSLAKGLPSVPPPRLLRQSQRNVNFVDSLVDSSTQIVEAIWPLPSLLGQLGRENKEVFPLRTFIQETLRRSRTSYSTLQVTLYYLILIKPHVLQQQKELHHSLARPQNLNSTRALLCGRSMFLTALILASKYLQDRNYSARAWSKISGLNILDINRNELVFLLAVNWQLHITEAVFQRWTDIFSKYTAIHPLSGGATSLVCGELSPNWKMIVLGLNVQLDNITDVISRSNSLSAGSVCNINQMPVVIGKSDTSYDLTETPLAPSNPTPKYLEPSLSAYSTVRTAPALGLFPTTNLTPQFGISNPPALSTAPHEFFMPYNGISKNKPRLNTPTVHVMGKKLNGKPSPKLLDTCHYPSTLISPNSMTSDSVSQFPQIDIMPRSAQVVDFEQVNTCYGNTVDSRLDGIALELDREYEFHSIYDPFTKKSARSGTELHRQCFGGVEAKERFCANNDVEAAETLRHHLYHPRPDIPYLYANESCKTSIEAGVSRGRSTCVPLGDYQQRLLRKRPGMLPDSCPSLQASDFTGSDRAEGNTSGNQIFSRLRSKSLLASNCSSSNRISINSSISSDHLGLNNWASNDTPPPKRICYARESCRFLSHNNFHSNLCDGFGIFPRLDGLQ